MRNLGFFLSLCLLSAVSALAAETNRPAAAAPDEASQIAAAEEQPVEIAAPELDAAPEFEVGATPRPECSDPRMTQKIVEKIEAYQSEHPAAMLIDRRRDILLRRNLSRFGEVKVEGFTAKQDFNVANAIIMTKINRGLNDADLRLCRRSRTGQSRRCLRFGLSGRRGECCRHHQLPARRYGRRHLVLYLRLADFSKKQNIMLIL